MYDNTKLEYALCSIQLVDLLKKKCMYCDNISYYIKLLLNGSCLSFFGTRKN